MVWHWYLSMITEIQSLVIQFKTRCLIVIPGLGEAAVVTEVIINIIIMLRKLTRYVESKLVMEPSLPMNIKKIYTTLNQRNVYPFLKVIRIILCKILTKSATKKHGRQLAG